MNESKLFDRSLLVRLNLCNGTLVLDQFLSAICCYAKIKQPKRNSGIRCKICIEFDVFFMSHKSLSSFKQILQATIYFADAAFVVVASGGDLPQTANELQKIKSFESRTPNRKCATSHTYTTKQRYGFKATTDPISQKSQKQRQRTNTRILQLMQFYVDCVLGERGRLLSH